MKRCYFGTPYCPPAVLVPTAASLAEEGIQDKARSVESTSSSVTGSNDPPSTLPILFKASPSSEKEITINDKVNITEQYAVKIHN